MRPLNSSLHYFIVQKAQISNKEAVQVILSGRVMVNGIKGQLHQVLQPEDEVRLDNQVIKKAATYSYLAYYKPRGVESTLNPQIANNLLEALKLDARVFPVGRLDKESEGLLLLTNNGKIYDSIIHADSHQEKEYLVTVDKPLTPATLEQLSQGILIMGQKTRPAVLKQINLFTFSIILTQGLNRQIRRMCYKLGFQVIKLIRTRIITVSLGKLKPGEWRYLSTEEWQDLNRKLSGGELTGKQV